MNESIEHPLDVVATVRSLELPEDQCVVFGSGPLSVRGLRESKDVDLLVTPQLFDALKARGWRADTVTIEDRPRERLSHSIFEAFSAFWVNGRDYDITELIRSADVIDGIRFMRLSDVIELKRAMGREKDMRDIELIESYLREHPEER